MPEKAATKPVMFFTLFFGWGMRNFFQTGVIDLLLKEYHVVVLASPQMKAGMESLGYDKKVEIVELPEGTEPWSWRLFRQARKKLYVESRNSVNEALWIKYQKRPLYQRVGGAIFKLLTRIVPAFTLYKFLETLDYAINKETSLAPLFKKYQPRFVLFSHATHYRDERVMRNALAAGTPTVFMVLSWDQVSTAKILLSKYFSRILVWCGHSQEEIWTTYPHLDRRATHVVGIPQYDFYAQKPDLTYAEWCARYNLDPSRRTILFSTMPQHRHEQQHIIIERLLDWMEAPDNADLNLQLMVKTHPFDSFGGYAEVQKRKPKRMGLHRTTLPAGMNQSDWIPSAHEIEASRNCLYFCTVNINIFSTVTIEAAYFDKPVVHIAFDPAPPVGRIPCREYYNWDHFKHIVEKNATTLVESFDELFSAIRKYIERPEEQRRERRTLVDAYIGKPVGTAAQAVADNLIEYGREIASRRPAGV